MKSLINHHHGKRDHRNRIDEMSVRTVKDGEDACAGHPLAIPEHLKEIKRQGVVHHPTLISHWHICCKWCGHQKHLTAIRYLIYGSNEQQIVNYFFCFHFFRCSILWKNSPCIGIPPVHQMAPFLLTLYCKANQNAQRMYNCIKCSRTAAIAYLQDQQTFFVKLRYSYWTGSYGLAWAATCKKWNIISVNKIFQRAQIKWNWSNQIK